MGDSLYFGPASASTLSWASYSFQVGIDNPRSLSVSYTVSAATSKSEIWIALADYASLSWKVAGPYVVTPPGVGSFAVTQTAEMTSTMKSPLNNVYAAVIVFGDQSAMVDSLTLTTSGSNATPLADIRPSTMVGVVDSDCSLDASASSDSDGTIVRYQWDLDGDGNYEVDSTPLTAVTIHFPAVPTNFIRVGLRVTDDTGVVDTVTLDLSCKADQPPQARCRIIPRTGLPGDIALMDASSSFDPVGYIVNFKWDLDDDGVFEIDGGAVPSMQTTFPAERRIVGVQVTDDFGGTDRQYITISSTLTVMEASDVYDMSNMLLVEGNPAVAYGVFNMDVKEVRFIRALDAAGAVWGTPIILASDWGGGKLSLALIGGRPAVAFSDWSGQISYCSATDFEGGIWSAPSAVTVGKTYCRLTLAEVDGRPAIAYVLYPFSNKDICYIRALDQNGQGWGPSVGVGLGNYNDALGMVVVNGNPALAYSSQHPDFGFNYLHFARALDPQGTNWGAPAMITDYETCGQMLLFNGRPAIAGFAAEDSGKVNFLTAEDDDAVAWSERYETPLYAEDLVASLTQGKPLICAASRGSFALKAPDYLFLMYAKDPGAQNWGQPLLLDSTSNYGAFAMTGLDTGVGFAYESQGLLVYDHMAP